MNLTAILREGSLTDLNWYRDGMKTPGEVTFDPSGSKNLNDVKPEAQGQWGYGDISPIFDEPAAGVVSRNIPEEDLGDAAPVVVFARHMMNQGAPAGAVDRELKARFTKEEMRKGLRGLRELFAMDGIVGRIAIDARGYKGGCAEAAKATSRSPYKRFIRFVIGCSCGDPHMIPVEGQKQEIVASTGIPADDFFADEAPYQVKEVPHCPSTMLPLYAADDVDPEWADDLLLVVDDVSGIPGDESKRIRMLDEKPVKKLQMAFRAIDKAALESERSRYSGVVNASEHVIVPAENEIELFAEAQPDLEIDEAPGDFIGQEVPSILAEEQVDMAMNVRGTIFEGSDVIDLDEPSIPQPDLEIDMNSEMTW